MINVMYIYLVYGVISERVREALMRLRSYPLSNSDCTTQMMLFMNRVFYYNHIGLV